MNATESLPSGRAFLIRFGAGADPAHGVHRGRIEHVNSGRTMRFDSLEGITLFISEVIAEEAADRSGSADGE